MKKIILFSLLLATCSFNLQAQFEIGMRLGMSTQDVNADDIFLQSNNVQDLAFRLENASYGYHVGLYTQFKLLGLTITPELNFNSNQYEYRIQDIGMEGNLNELVTDRYQYLDIPVLFGVKFLFLRAYAGPEVHYFINSFSELSEIDGFSEQFEKLNYGAIAGVGLNIGRVRLDLRYEVNFNDLGDHIFYEGNQINFQTDNTRLIFTAGIRFN